MPQKKTLKQTVKDVKQVCDTAQAVVNTVKSVGQKVETGVKQATPLRNAMVNHADRVVENVVEQAILGESSAPRRLPDIDFDNSGSNFEYQP